jgi:molecular chaperone DnaK
LSEKDGKDKDSPGQQSSPDIVERYGRKGGSARKEPVKAGFWQRMVDWVAPPAPGATRTANEERRIALELILPSDNRVLVLCRMVQDRSSGILELRVEPAPANSAQIIEALAAISHGTSAASAASDELDGIRPVTGPVPPVPPARRPPSAPHAPIATPVVPAAPAPPARPAAATTPGVAAVPAPPAPAPAAPARRPPSTPHAPIAAPAAAPLSPPPQDPATMTGSDEFRLPDPAGWGDAVEAEEAEVEPPTPPRPAPVSTPTPPPTPPTESSRPTRGPSRGGAARELFSVPEEEKTPTDGLKAPAPEPSPLDELVTRLPEMRSAPASRDVRPTEETVPLMSAAEQVSSVSNLPSVMVEDEAAPETTEPFAASQTEPFDARQEPEPAAPPQAYEPEPLPPEPPPPLADHRRKFLPIVGIDFGTTYSSVAVMRAGLEVIPDENGELQMPSVVSFPRPGEIIIGAEARARMAGEAQWTIASPKRLLGRLYKDPQVSQLVGGLAFRTFAGSDKFVRFEAHNEIYSVTDICAMILSKLRERACRFLNAEVSKAVFTVPVGFGTLQRSALELAARQAGLEVVGMLTEPSAGVLSHGFRGRRGLVGVYDFGGGTFDFCLLEISETAFQVLCAGGDPWLGGDDLDYALANELADNFWNDTAVDLRTRAVEWQRLIFGCERAKRELSSKKEAEIRLDDLLFTSQGKKGLRTKVSRKDFLRLIKPLIEKSLAVTDKVLGQAKIPPKKVDAVVLTGGTSLIPAVRDAVTEYFGKKPVIGDPNLAVAKGAALRGAELGGEAIAETSMGGRTLREVAGRTIGAGIRGKAAETLFDRNTPLPAEVRHTFHTTEDGQTEMVIALYEESKSRIDESRTIGHLRYKGLRPAPAGQGRVDFVFILDEDGMLHVSAMVEGKQFDKSIKLG